MQVLVLPKSNILVLWQIGRRDVYIYNEFSILETENNPQNVTFKDTIQRLHEIPQTNGIILKCSKSISGIFDKKNEIKELRMVNESFELKVHDHQMLTVMCQSKTEIYKIDVQNGQLIPLRTIQLRLCDCDLFRDFLIAKTFCNQLLLIKWDSNAATENRNQLNLATDVGAYYLNEQFIVTIQQGRVTSIDIHKKIFELNNLFSNNKNKPQKLVV